MGKIYFTEEDKNAFFLKKKNGGVLVSDPNQFVNNFFVHALNKYGIIPFNEGILKMMEQQKNIHQHKLAEMAKPAMVKAVSRHRRNNLTNLQSALEAIEAGEDVICTPTGGVLFLEFLASKNLKVEDLGVEVDSELLLDEMIDIYNEIKNPDFYPEALERLLKLFSIFYNKKLEKNELNIIGKLQIELLHIKDEINLTSDLNLVKSIIQKIKEKEEIVNNVNIFDKILEEIELLEDIMSSEHKISVESFVKIKKEVNHEDAFIEMYSNVIY